VCPVTPIERLRSAVMAASMTRAHEPTCQTARKSVQFHLYKSLYSLRAWRQTMDSAASLTEARDRLSEIVDSAATSGEAFTITKHGRPMAVILSYDEYESLIETLNVLSDADTMAAIAEAREEVFEDIEDG